MNPILAMLVGAIAPAIPNAIEKVWEEYKTDVTEWFSDTKTTSKDSTYYNSIKEHTDDK